MAAPPADWRARCRRLRLEPGEQEAAGPADWCWRAGPAGDRRPAALLSAGGAAVLFHPTYSSGTAWVQGTAALDTGRHHFWEVTVDSPVYGTDVMVGLALGSADLAGSQRSYCSLLGLDGRSWGWSYHGHTHHDGRRAVYGPAWAQGDRLGVHLDSWRGTCEFYLNRQPLGTAFSGLRGKELYPVISSTAAKSSMTLVTARSLQPSLQFLAVRTLAHKLPGSSLLSLLLPPGIRNFIRNNYWFLLDHRRAPAPPPYMLYYPVSPPRRPRPLPDRRLPGLAGPSQDSDETDSDADCFLATPAGRREARAVLLARSRGEQGAEPGGAIDRGAMDRGAMDRGAMDRGAMDRGAMDRGAMDRGRGEQEGEPGKRLLLLPVAGAGSSTEEDSPAPTQVKKRLRLSRAKK